MKQVYFIKPVGMDGPIKVGSSKSPEDRRDSLSTWSPFALEIVARIDGDAILERRFHAAFVDSHQRREWFGASPTTDRVIAEINAGTFDVETLPEPRCLSNKIAGNKKPRTEKQNADLSLSLRISHMARRAGCSCKVYPYQAHQRDDQLLISAAEGFLRDPLRYGRHIDTPWALNARTAWAKAAAA